MKEERVEIFAFFRHVIWICRCA